jgi:hypothetical protein
MYLAWFPEEMVIISLQGIKWLFFNRESFRLMRCTDLIFKYNPGWT